MELEFRHLIDALPGLVWIALPDGRAELLNQRWREFTGKRIDEAVGVGWQDAIHPEDLPALLESWRSLLETGKPGEVEARLRRHDGVYRRFLMSTAPITDASGKVVKWCGINTDIEDRLREGQRHLTHARTLAEEALKLSAAELQQAAAHFSVAQRLSATGSFVSDLLADEHTWSEELYRIFDLDPGIPLTKHSMRDLVHTEDLELYDSVIEHGMADNDVDFEFRIVTARGNLKYLHFAALISRHIADRPVFMGAVRDITDSRIAEEDLRRAHGHLAEAQRLSKTGSFTSDMLNDEHIWSDEFYRICNFEPGSHVTIRKLRQIVHPEDVPSFEAAMGRALAGRDTELVFRIVTSQGMVKHLRGVAHRIQQITDRPVFVGAIQDVTAVRVGEHALNVARAELAHLTRVMTLGALTASIAHEVNQPLSGIITNASTCLRMLAAEPPNLEGARATAQRTIRDGKRASDVLQRLRAMFGRKQPTLEAVDLNDAAREVLALSSSELQGCRVILRTDFSEGLPAIRGDRVQLQQVMLNLVLNAADAMREVDDRPRNLLVSTARDGVDRVRLSVRDCGVGIDPRHFEKLFEAFYTTKSHGMGVGLSISRSIIESHDGRLWAAVNDGPGATFSFSIPCLTPPPSLPFR